MQWSGRESNSNSEEDSTQVLKKSSDDKYHALLNLRTTPGKDNITSPVTKLLKREQRKLLPMIARPMYKSSAEKKPNKNHRQLHSLNLRIMYAFTMAKHGPEREK